MTNTPSNTATRAPGCFPAIYFIETAVELMAAKLGVDPADFRQQNMYQKNQMTPMHQTVPYCSLSSMWDSFMTSSDFQARKAAVATFNKANRWRYATGTARLVAPCCSSACFPFFFLSAPLFIPLCGFLVPDPPSMRIPANAASASRPTSTALLTLA